MLPTVELHSEAVNKRIEPNNNRMVTYGIVHIPRLCTEISTWN
jgi:hypothetical protein